MNNEEINLDFLDNIKIDDDNKDDVVDNEVTKQYDFEIDNNEEENLDFDLNELINKIDTKIEELNKEENDVNNMSKEIDDSTDNIALNDEYNVNELINRIDAKLEELNKENASDKSNDVVSDVNESSESNDMVINEDTNDFDVNELINKIDAKLEEFNEEKTEVNEEISEVIDEKNAADIPAVTDLKDIVSDNKKTDINNLFEKVNSNVKEASDIFTKNVEMKKKLDKRFEELKKLQKDIEASKQSDYDEINNYKDAVLEELTSKKNEVELKLNELKELQAKFEKEKYEFEKYKKAEKARLDDFARDNKVRDDSRKEELEKLENKLRRQKDSIDEEKRQLSLDRIEYEADKNELANNMLKFNEIVGTFTDGVGNLN